MAGKFDGKEHASHNRHAIEECLKSRETRGAWAKNYQSIDWISPPISGNR